MRSTSRNTTSVTAAFVPGSNIDRITHHGVRPSHLRPHVADAHTAGVYANTDLQRRPAAARELLVQGRAFALHLERGEHAVARVTRVLHRRSPKCHDGVAHVLVERTLVLAADDGAHLGQVLVDVLAQMFGAERLGNAGKAAYVGKQDGELGVARLHVVLFRVFGHLVHELGRNVLPEQLGELALGTRLDEVAISHVDGVKRDRKSTRLNSSHVEISYAVFCLKKKKKKK